MIIIYTHIEDPRIYGIYVKNTRYFYISTNKDAAGGVIYLK